MHIAPSQDLFDIDVNLFDLHVGGNAIANHLFRRFQPRVVCFFQVINVFSNFAKPFPLFRAVPGYAGYDFGFVGVLLHIE